MIDKKKALVAIMATKPKKPEAKAEPEIEESESEESEAGPEMELEAAAEDVIGAFEAKDAVGLASALKAFLSLC